MSFLSPSFLWALCLLAIPLIIHLFNFRRYKKVVFSNVDMLKEIQTESRKTRQVKKWLVLLCRMVVVAALVIAFAQPYLPNNDSATGKQLVSIYLDNSESMRSSGEDGQLFENAKNSARQILDNLPQDADIQIIDNALSPYSNRVFNATNATKIIDDMDVDFHPNDLTKVIQKANNKFLGEGYASQHTFVLSDFQTGDNPGNVVLDSSLNLHLLRFSPLALQNLSVDSVWLEEPVSRPNTPVKLKVKIVNNGSERVESSSAILKINGVQQGVESFGLAARDQVVLDMTFTSAQKGWIDGEISINDVPVTFDNRYFFSLHIKSTINVLQIGDRSADIARVFGTDPVFSLAQTSPGAIDYTSFGLYDFILLHELRDVPSGLAEQLRQFVDDGGVLAVIPSSKQMKYSSIEGLFGMAKYGAIQNKNVSISASNLKNPFYRNVYKKVPENIILPKIKKCYSLSPTATTQQILSLKDNSIILAKTKLGSGSIYQFAMPLKAEYSNFSTHEIFVLTMLKMAFSKSTKQQLAHKLYSDEVLTVDGKVIDQSNLVLTKGQKSILVENSMNNGSVKFWLNEEINDAGVYSLKTQEGPELSKVALNYTRVESKQQFDTDENLQEKFNGVKIEMINGTTASIKNVTDALSHGRPLWKVFIVLGLVFLLIEIILLRFLKS